MSRKDRTRSSAPSYTEVQQALETLNSSYSHDPPERWLASYELLSGLKARLAEAKKAYAWIGIIGTAATFAAIGYATLRFLIHSDQMAFFWLFGASVIQSVSFALANHLAERREPLLRLDGDIRSACRRFERTEPAPLSKAPAT